jgi:carbonic anhydrase/acetyltransferase-like protein (isoleucine patch superfamily)
VTGLPPIAKTAAMATLSPMPSRAPLVLPYVDQAPSIASPPTHAGIGSVVLGRITLGRDAWLGALSVMRADGHFVKVGDDFHLGARSTVHIAHDIFPCIIGDRVAVGENACVHACTVGSDVVIDDGTVILDGAVVEDGVVFQPGSTVFPNKRIASGFLYAGSPAKPVRPLDASDVAERRRALVSKIKSRREPAQPRIAIAAGSDIHDTVFVASTATLTGRIVAAPSSSIWYGNNFDAGRATISIGPRTNIQDNTVIHCSVGGTTIGRDTTVGHNVTIRDSIIGDGTLIGIGSMVDEGTVIGDRVLLAAGARTTPCQKLESGWLYGGSPARQMSELDAAKIEMIDLIIGQYCQYAQDFRAAERALLAAGATP